MDAQEAKTGLKQSYKGLSELTGVSLDTIKSLASRASYNVTLATLTKLCVPIGEDPRHYLEWTAEDLVKQSTKNFRR